MSVAGRGLAWPGACGRWLPVWLPGFVSAAQPGKPPRSSPRGTLSWWTAWSGTGRCASGTRSWSRL